jgi:hypothetical protein
MQILAECDDLVTRPTLGHALGQLPRGFIPSGFRNARLRPSLVSDLGAPLGSSVDAMYSVYIIGPGDSVIERIDLSCLDDTDTLQQAKSGHGFAQLWQASRFVATLEPTIFDV